MDEPINQLMNMNQSINNESINQSNHMNMNDDGMDVGCVKAADKDDWKQQRRQ